MLPSLLILCFPVDKFMSRYAKRYDKKGAK